MKVFLGNSTVSQYSRAILSTIVVLCQCYCESYVFVKKKLSIHGSSKHCLDQDLVFHCRKKCLKECDNCSLFHYKNFIIKIM